MRYAVKDQLVSIIIPLFNQAYCTRKCLSAIEKNTPKHLYELILVDNASTDSTPDLLRKLKGNLRIITNSENMGFSKANNQGAKIATGKYLLFLNNDTEPHVGWLEEMLTVADSNAKIGIVGSKLLFPDGTIQHAGVCIPPIHLHRGLPGDFIPADKSRDFQIVTGACMLIRKDLFFKIQGFDEQFVNGCEDVDLCLKANKAGARVFYTSRSVLTHHEGKSEGREDKMDYNREYLNKKWKDEQLVPDFQKYMEQDGFRWQGTQWIYNQDLCRPTLSIIIVTYNSIKDVAKCIASIQKSTIMPYEIIVVDNNSSDGTRDLLRQFENKSYIKAILNNENRGFSASTNLGITASNGDYIVLLNPDTIVTKDWAWRLMLHFDDKTGAVGPVTNYVAGIQKIEFHLKENVDGINIEKLADKLYSWNQNKSKETKLLIGFCLMLRREIIDRIGMLDENLFLGSDDLEYSLRLRANGYKLLAATDTFVYHKGQASFDSEPSQKMNKLTQQSQDALYAKLERTFSPQPVPTSLELWGMDWFKPTQLHNLKSN